MSTQRLDANGRVIASNEAFLAVKDVTYTAAGDGEQGQHTLFTVTGHVIAQINGFCETSLEGATATLDIGSPGQAELYMGPFTATNIDAGFVINEAGVLADSNYPFGTYPINGADIVQNVGTTDITAGRIVWYVTWRPLSEDGNVVAA